jgi:hypothetical protein
MTTSRSRRCSEQWPSVCPGVKTTSGDPGTGSTPPSYVCTSPIGRTKNAPETVSEPMIGIARGLRRYGRRLRSCA